MPDVSILPPTPALRRPRFRFTLRLLIAFVTLVGLALGFWTHRAREQRRLVQRIRASGGKVAYDSHQMRRKPLFVQSVVPRAIIDLLGEDYFHDVVEAEIFDPALLVELPRLSNLSGLHINSHQLTDDDFAPIARLRRLRGIDIYGDKEDFNTQIGARSMKLLAELPELELINLVSSRITASDLAVLAQSKSLEKLNVASPDESLDALAADPFRERLSHLFISRSTPGGFGPVIESWQLSRPPGPRVLPGAS
jgi:hypothetical protein